MQAKGLYSFLEDTIFEYDGEMPVRILVDGVLRDIKDVDFTGGVIQITAGEMTDMG